MTGWHGGGEDVLKIDLIAVNEHPRIIFTWNRCLTGGKIKDFTHCVFLKFLSHSIYAFFSWVKFHTK